MGSSGGGSVTVGYHYYMNVHFAIAHGAVNELYEIRIGDRVAWRGNLTESSSVTIKKLELFGGEKREGGVMGTVDLMSGESNQPVNPSLQSAVSRATGSSDIPAYRGISTLFFKGADGVNMTGTPWSNQLVDMISVSGDGALIQALNDLLNLVRSSFLWGAMNPYFKTPAFLVRRIWKDWYPEKAKIGENANPIHIIYETLTNKVWGLGYPSQDIDDSSFRAAADVMFNEGFGLSMRWSNQSTIEEFIKMVNEHINATLVEDRATGRWRMIMVRDNYNIDDLFELNESNCVVEEFQRKTMGETINEVVVAFTRPEDGETDTVTTQNLANFANTGQINSQKKEYPGIADADTAFRIAMRDLNTLSKPIAKITVTCDQSIMGQYPGDVIKLNWPRLGLNGIPVRIGKMNLGSLTQGEIQIEAVEDVFALPDNAYIERQPIGWVDSQRQAEPVTDQNLFELTYYELYTSTDTADRLEWPEDIGFVAAASLSPNSDSNSLALYDNVGQREVGNGEFTTLLFMSEPAGYMDTVLTPDLTGIDVTVLLAGGLAYLGDELIQITNYNITTGKVTVKRGLIDTVPAKHPVGEKLWFYARNDYVLDTTDRVAGEAVSYKLLSETSVDKLELSQAPSVSYTLQNRQLRPYRPGNLKVNGVSYPDVIDGSELVVSWAHRDRTQELLLEPTSYLTGNIGPELGVTYNLVIKGENGTVLKEELGLADTQFAYPSEADDSNNSSTSPTGLYTIVSSPRDPLLVNTTTVLNFNGADNSTTVTDDTGFTTWTAFNDAKVKTAESVYGGSSIYFDGSSDYIQADQGYPEHDIQPGDDFTIEYWVQVHPTATTSTTTPVGKSNGGSTTCYSFEVNTNRLRFIVYTNGSGASGVGMSASGITLNRGEWYHVAVSREGLLTRLFLNGAMVASSEMPDMFSSPATPLRLGQLGYNGFNYWFKGWIDNFIFTKGKAWYTTNFMVSQQESPGDTIEVGNRLNANLEIELKSVRDGLESYQTHTIDVERAGYGFNYGNFYGGAN